MIELQPEIIVARVSSHISTLMVPNRNMAGIENSVDGMDTKITNPRSNNIILQHYDSWTSSSPWLRDLFGQFQYSRNYRNRRGKDREDFFVKYGFPNWLWARALEFRGYEHTSGWQYNLQTYRELPDDAPFFKCVLHHDIVKARNMLVKGEALVTDRSDYSGETALHVSIIPHSPN